MRKRSGRPERFTMIANSAIDDDRLDMTVLGLHTFLVRCKDGYDIDMDTLAKRRGPGRRMLYSAMRTLVEYGYVVKIKFQNERGRWETEVFIYDTPATPREVAATVHDEFADARSVRVEPAWLDPNAPEEPADLDEEPTDPEPVKPQITPTDQNRQAGSEDGDSPACHYRPVGHRPVGNRSAKYLKTNTKTNTKNRPSRPSEPVDARETPATDGRTDGNAPPPTSQTPPPPPVVDETPGVLLLGEIASSDERYLLTGEVLADQGARVDALLAAGFTPAHIRQAVAGRPLPDDVGSVGALVSYRLKQLAGSPVPAPRTGTDQPHADAGAPPADPAGPPICPDHVNGLRMRIDPETEAPYRCPDCHPLAMATATPAF